MTTADHPVGDKLYRDALRVCSTLFAQIGRRAGDQFLMKSSTKAIESAFYGELQPPAASRIKQLCMFSAATGDDPDALRAELERLGVRQENLRSDIIFAEAAQRRLGWAPVKLFDERFEER